MSTAEERTRDVGARCTRSWEVEAARDGRLSGSATEAIARHLEDCSECRASSDYLSGLGPALRAIRPPPVVPSTLRQRILERADAKMLGRSLPPSERRRRVLLALAAALVVASALGVMKWRAVSIPPAVAPSPATTVEAVDEGGARWMTVTDGTTEAIVLSEGTLQVRVRRPAGGKRVIIRVPDGEIEDVGTTFHVVVANGRTERVVVDEGAVRVRLAELPSAIVPSGASWQRPTAERSIATAAATPPFHVGPAPISRQPVAPPSRAADVAETESEDAAYLEAIHLLREGRHAEAKAAAREYLRRFPRGFRRTEMDRIAR